MDSFRRHCVEGLAAKGKRIDELMRQSLMLVTALAPRIGYDNAARIAEPAHLNGTSLREETLASGLVSAGEFDAPVRPEAMLAPSLNSILQPTEVNADKQKNSHQTAIDNEGPCRESFKNAQQAPDRGKSR